MNKFTVDQAVQAAIKPFVDTLKRFDDNTDDIGLFEWFNRYADEELIYDSLVNLAALQATPQPAPAGELVAAVKPFAELWEMFEKERAQRILTNPDYEIRDFLNRYTSGIYLQNRWRELVEAAVALKGE